MSNGPVVLVQGAHGLDDVPGLSTIADEAQLHFAATPEALAEGIKNAEVILGWDFRVGALRSVWQQATELRWIQWTGAGVDAILFPELQQSDVVLTNAAGVFDKPMAEFVLATILAFAKHVPQNARLQSTHTWQHRLTEAVENKRVLVVGAGSIGTCIGQLLKAVGMRVTGLSRGGRTDDPVFGTVYPLASLHDELGKADYVVLVPALTPETRGMFGTEQFAAMKPNARFLNLGRGALVDEDAMLTALQQGIIAGAGLDVFSTEPLPQDSPFWDLEQVIISPHMSGDLEESGAQLSELFIDNFRRYRAGKPLRNVVDKQRGYVGI